MRMLIASLTLVGLVVASNAEAENRTVASAISGFVRPAYSQFHKDAGVLKEALTQLCAAPTLATLGAAREKFADVVQSWSEVELIRFGPVTEENRLERILFWPDRKSIGLKQVQGALAEQDPSATSAESLANKSVAMQGLGALEFVLFGADADQLLDKAGEYRCRYGQAISGNLETMATEIEAAWRQPDGVAKLWANPGADNPLYRDDNEALTELFNILVHGLEMVRDVRINGFLGAVENDDKPKQAIYWRSRLTLASIEHNLAGLQKAFDASDMKSILPEDSAWLAGSVIFEFTNARKALDMPADEIVTVLADPALREKVDYARLVTSSLSEIFGVRLSGSLGLTAGFSSLDGD